MRKELLLQTITHITTDYASGRTIQWGLCEFQDKDLNCGMSSKMRGGLVYHCIGTAARSSSLTMSHTCAYWPYDVTTVAQSHVQGLPIAQRIPYAYITLAPKPTASPSQTLLVS